MNELLKIFSTREISIITWSLILIIIFLLSKKIRKSVFDITPIFNKKSLSIFGVYLFYYGTVILLLNKTILWDVNLLKDSIIWLVFSSSVLMFRSIKIDKNYDFIVLLFQDFKLILYFEFLVNFYTFSLWQELIIIPFLSLIVIMYQVDSIDESEKEDYKEVISCLSNILSIIGFLLYSIVLYKTIINYKELLTYENYKSLLLPIVLMFTNMPFFYFLALWSAYGQLLLNLNCCYSIDEVKKIKRILFSHCKLNLQKVRKITEEVNYGKSIDDLKANIKS